MYYQRIGKWPWAFYFYPPPVSPEGDIGIVSVRPSVHPSVCSSEAISQKLLDGFSWYLAWWQTYIWEWCPSFSFFEKIQNGWLMPIFVPKLDIFAYKSLLIAAMHPKFSELLEYYSLLLHASFWALWPHWRGHLRSRKVTKLDYLV